MSGKTTACVPSTKAGVQSAMDSAFRREDGPKNSRGGRLFLAMSFCALAAACGKPATPLPAIQDQPVPVPAAYRDLPETIPGYGVALEGTPQVFEVTIEAEDTPKLRAGEIASVVAPPDYQPISCRVARALPHASEETGQSLAWLKPSVPTQIPPNEYVYASITTNVRGHVLTVPESAVLVHDGKTFVITRKSGAGTASWSPVEVQTGNSADGAIEIRTGLRAGDTVSASGAIGYLYPDFKTLSGD